MCKCLPADVITQALRRQARNMCCGIAAFCLLVVGPSSTTLAQMYSDDLLAAKIARIKGNLYDTIKIDIPANAPPALRAAAARVVPDLRDRNLEIIDFLHEGSVVPVGADSLQFIDDLSTVAAWLSRRGCAEMLLFSYIVHHATPNVTIKDPISAFGLDREAVLRDGYVQRVSDKFYNSAIWFLLAHEVGHVALGHVGPANREQEDEADAFAIEVMRNKRLMPAGISLYMMTISLYDRTIAARTHATGGERLHRIAASLRKSPADFVAQVGQEQQVRDTARVLSIATDLDRFGRVMNEIRDSEQRLVSLGADITEVYRESVLKEADYASACPASP
ncbi:hypothetical protein [Rhodopseudomonas sp.]|uniref:hypothetical protein n=1 Tax=Rhodopseudomonas sp. TaxID=1078 RepID=UPI003B3B7A0E